MRVIPVLDLKGGQVVRGIGGRRAEYRPIISVLTDSAKPLDVARAFRVGMGDGTGTVALCRELACRHPELELIAGGGIGNAADLKRLQENGVNAALVASALHNGNLMPEDWGRPWSLAEHAKSAE